MRRAIVVGTLLSLSLVACGKKEEVPEPQTSVPVASAPAGTPPVPPQAPPATQEAPPPPVAQAPAAAPEPPPVAAAPAAPQADTKAKAPAEERAAAEPGKSAAAPSRDEALALANKSGCLACHAVDNKVVGPAWKDVAARYKGDAGAHAQLVQKVKKGGQGNWTQVTGGMPMPPYSPRVADQDIDTLVRFILSL